MLVCPAPPQVIRAWAVLAERGGWAKLPRYALGASSGGAMALALAQRLPLDGVCSVIMAVPPQAPKPKPKTNLNINSTYLPCISTHTFSQRQDHARCVLRSRCAWMRVCFL